MIGHHMLDGIAHGNILHHLEAVVAQSADSVFGTDPDLPADVLHGRCRIERRDVLSADGGEVCLHAAVADFRVLRPHIQPSRVFRIGQNAADAFDAAFLTAEEGYHAAVPEGKEIPVLGEAVDQAVRAGAKLPDRLPVKPLILQQAELQRIVNHRDPAGSTADIDEPLLILGDGADTDRTQALLPAPVPVAALHHGEHAGIVGSDPEPVPAVHKKAAYICDPGGRADTLKTAAVIADQTGITANPDKALGRLCDGVCLRGRQAVPVVVQHCGKALALLNRVNGEPDVPVAGEIEDLVFRRAAYGNQALRQADCCQQQADQQPAGAASCSVVETSGHELTP